ncbi:hypothetical protein J6590_018072 [Homalodisca vitripennis]|nr:hypothetical protein J6590_018072 [Homalodisca vitripennis]
MPEVDGRVPEVSQAVMRCRVGQAKKASNSAPPSPSEFDTLAGHIVVKEGHASARSIIACGQTVVPEDSGVSTLTRINFGLKDVFGEIFHVLRYPEASLRKCRKWTNNTTRKTWCDINTSDPTDRVHSGVISTKYAQAATAVARTLSDLFITQDPSGAAVVKHR